MPARNLPAAIQSRLNDAVILPVLFVEMRFDSPTGTIRLHTDLGTINTLGQDWLGTGDLGAVGKVEETTELAAIGLKLTLSGVNQTLRDQAITENYQERECVVYFGLRDIATGVLVSDPYEFFFGVMSDMSITQQSIELSVESEMALWNRSHNEMFTDVALQRAYPGDFMGQFLGDLQDLKLRWGPPDNPTETPGTDGEFSLSGGNENQYTDGLVG